ncbi:MAG: AAA family ATPase [Methanoregula sp.]|jgi:predicted ATPase|nr:AAA family ATPase [Methanoregula sp.]
MHIRSLTFLHDTFPKAECYPFSLDVFRKTERLAFTTPVTFLIGENGTGKSTLLQAIARGSGIHIWEEREGRRDTTNLHEDQLHQSIRIDWTDGKVPGSFFASEHFRHFAEALDQWGKADAGCLDYFGSRSLIVKSHGQSHMAFFEHRFARKGLYLLDEPENALSPKWQLELLRLLRRFSGRGDVQFIIATHSPILLALPDAAIYSFDEAPVRRVEYEDTDYYRIYRDFLDNREKYLDGE